MTIDERILNARMLTIQNIVDALFSSEPEPGGPELRWRIFSLQIHCNHLLSTIASAHFAGQATHAQLMFAEGMTAEPASWLAIMAKPSRSSWNTQPTETEQWLRLLRHFEATTGGDDG